jgi:protein SCO1/2
MCNVLTSNVSRRKLLRLLGVAPLAGGALAAFGATSANFGGAHPTDSAGATSAPSAGLTMSEKARRRIQEQHLPNIPLITQDGQQVRFYDDLVKGKVVSLNFFFAKCEEVCPVVMANLAKVQKLLGDSVGRDIFMYSFTLKPEEDTVEVLKHHHHMFGAKPGWTYLTGNPQDLEKLRVAIGFSYPDPKIDADKTQHIGNVRYGNEPIMLWSACPGMAHAEFIAETLNWAIHPETSRVLKQ